MILPPEVIWSGYEITSDYRLSVQINISDVECLKVHTPPLPMSKFVTQGVMISSTWVLLSTLEYTTSFFSEPDSKWSVV